jgi:hypothetical protein
LSARYLWLCKRSDTIALALLLIVVVGLPVAIGVLAGSLDIPRNDDPSYRRVALDLYATGGLVFNGWSEEALVGQVLYAQPFLWLSGGSAWAFALATGILAAAGTAAGFWLVRPLISLRRSILAVLAVALFPGFLLNTTSFMTDVPAWAIGLICLGLGAIAQRREGSARTRWLAAALAAGFFGCTIREFVIAAPVAVILVFALSASGPRRIRYWTGAVGVLAACASVHFAVGLLPDHYGGMSIDLSRATLANARLGVATLALGLSPALAMATVTWWRRWRALDVAVGLLAGLLLFRPQLVQVIGHGIWPRVLLGNMIEASGSLDSGALAGYRPSLYGPANWQALNAAALLMGILLVTIAGGLVGFHARRLAGDLRRDWKKVLGTMRVDARSPWALVSTFALLYGGGIALWSLILPVYDRYLWPLLIPLYALLLRPAPEPEALASRQDPAPGELGPGVPAPRLRRPSGFPGTVAGGALALVLVAVLSATSLLLLANADAYDAARWHMGEDTAALGYSAQTTDAGFEWVAYHATGLATPGKPPPAIGAHYETWWPSFHLCALVSASPLKSDRLALLARDAHAYRLFLVGGPWEPLYLYGFMDSACPPVAPGSAP